MSTRSDEIVFSRVEVEVDFLEEKPRSPLLGGKRRDRLILCWPPLAALAGFGANTLRISNMGESAMCGNFINTSKRVYTMNECMRCKRETLKIIA